MTAAEKQAAYEAQRAAVRAAAHAKYLANANPTKEPA